MAPPNWLTRFCKDVLQASQGQGQELNAYETVRLMTGSDDTVLDDVSVSLTPSLMMFPLP